MSGTAFLRKLDLHRVKTPAEGYSEQMYELGHGLPLFHADPYGEYELIRVGDAGYIQ